ncbi:MAG: M56 family metallopeptidase, partial [Verrucomicrobiales bacterium]|nr:M56 family metallopeptidase [Verrucomicrobiales bacterium]
MNPPDLEFWGRTLVLLVVEIATLAGLAEAFARISTSSPTRKRIWQGALLAVVLLMLGELTGLRQIWRFHSSPANSGTTAARRIVATVSKPPTVDDISSATIPWQDSGNPPPAQPTRGAVWWPLWLWLGGTGLFGGRALAVRLWLLRARTHAQPGNSDAREILESLAPKLGLHRVHLCAWSGLRGPVAFGVFRPTIAVPRDLTVRFSPAQQEAMMAHELAHLAGRDPAWLACADLLVALTWWHPATWWMRRRFQAAAEATADSASSLVPQGPASLAESLIQLGRDLLPPGPVRGLGVAGGRFRSELGQRVDGLIHGAPSWRPPQARDRVRLFASAVFAVALFSLLPIPGGPDRSL